MPDSPVIDPNAGGSTTVTASMPPGPSSGAAEVLGGIPSGQPDTQGLGQAPRAPDITPVPPHRSFVGKILGAVADILGGKGENEINPQTGQREFHPFSRGQQAGNILSNAVRGFAAGTQAHGPGAGLRSMGLGAGAVAEQNLQREQIAHGQQMQEAELNQTKLLRNAQIALTNQEVARSVWQVEKESAGIDQQTAERINEMNAMVAQDSRNRDLGHYASFDEFISKYKTAEPDMLQKQAQGLIRAVPTFQNGKPTGVQLYEINPSWAEQRNDKPVPMPMPAGVDKNGQLTWKEVTIPSGGMTNGQIVQAGMNVGLKAMEVQANLTGKKIQAGAEIQGKEIEGKYRLAAAGMLAAPGGNGETPIDTQAKLMVDGQMDPSQLSKRAATYGATIAAANKYSMEKYGVPFDPAKATIDYKFAINPQTQNVLKYLNSLTGPDNQSGNLGELVKMSNAIPRGQYPPINDVTQWSKLQTGDPAIAAYYGAVTEVSDQVAKILQGGGSGNGTSDAKLEQAQKLFRVGFTPEQISATAETLRTLLGNRKQQLIGDNHYLQKQFGQIQPKQQASQQVTATNPQTGQKVIWNGQAWQPAQ